LQTTDPPEPAETAKAEIEPPATRGAQRQFIRLTREVSEDIATITKAIETISISLVRLSRNLDLIMTQDLWRANFRTQTDWIKSLGLSRTRVTQIRNCHDVFSRLLEEGFGERELPSTERLVRDLREYPVDMQKLLWKQTKLMEPLEGKPADREMLKRAKGTIPGTSATAPTDAEEDEKGNLEDFKPEADRKVKQEQTAAIIKGFDSLIRQVSVSFDFHFWNPVDIKTLRVRLDAAYEPAECH
jgi:hypothetical protein